MITRQDDRTPLSAERAAATSAEQPSSARTLWIALALIGGLGAGALALGFVNAEGDPSQPATVAGAKGGDDPVFSPWPATPRELLQARLDIIGAARAANEQGRQEDAVSTLERLALELEAGGSRVEAAEAWVSAGGIAELFDTRRAVTAFERAHDLDPASTLALQGLAITHFTLGRLDEAMEFASRAAEAGGPTDLKTIGEALQVIGLIHSQRGEHEESVEAWFAAIGAFSEAPHGRGVADTLNMLSTELVAVGRNEDALGAFEALFGVAEELDSDETLMKAHHGRANALENLGRYTEATADYEAAAALARDLGDIDAEASALLNLGNIARMEGDLVRSEDLLRRAYQISTAMEDRYSQAMALTNLGYVQAARGDQRGACDLWRQAKTAFDALQASEAATVAESMARAGCPD